MSFDLSYKDLKYFIDGKIYNCPYCKRNNIPYTVTEYGFVDWSNERTIVYYIVKCGDDECLKRSLHFSDYYLSIKGENFEYPPEKFVKRVLSQGRYSNVYEKIEEKGIQVTELDSLFFVNIPNDSFTIDNRIHHSIRDPLNEASGCLQNNFLTGASACLRKTVYKLLKHQGIAEIKNDGGAEKKFHTYEERIDLLKEKHSANRFVNQDFIEYLKGVHGLTSQELHENDWEDFGSKDITFLARLISMVLYQIYIHENEAKKEKGMLDKLRADARGVITVPSK